MGCLTFELFKESPEIEQSLNSIQGLLRSLFILLGFQMASLQYVSIYHRIGQGHTQAVPMMRLVGASTQHSSISRQSG